MTATPYGGDSYDALDDQTQTARRAAWKTQIADRISALDIAEEFEAEGQSWAEADRGGTTVIRHSRCDGQ